MERNEGKKLFLGYFFPTLNMYTKISSFKLVETWLRVKSDLTSQVGWYLWLSLLYLFNAYSVGILICVTATS